MAVTKKLLEEKMPRRNKGTASSRKPRSTTGSKAAKRADTESQLEEKKEASSAEESCGDGAARLWEAANREVAKRSKEIAHKLADKAALGDTACTKILVGLMNGRKPAPKKRPGAQTLAQQMTWDKPWTGPLVEGYGKIGEGGVRPE